MDPLVDPPVLPLLRPLLMLPLLLLPELPVDPDALLTLPELAPSPIVDESLHAKAPSKKEPSRSAPAKRRNETTIRQE
jgi:hypothetical protein